MGISFFTFQQLALIIDTYRGGVSEYSFIEYALFVTYFPQLIAGPIVMHEELIPQFKSQQKRGLNWNNLSQGIYIFTQGLAKKVLIADVFGNAVNWGFSNIELLDTTNVLIIMISYTIQIYFDFSGYSDMAIGIGKMMNIELPINFNSPYKALTIVDFWNRWHITLTRFLTQYIYIPLGGNRKGKIRTYINILIVFFVSGFWHGANWTFIIWGIVHGGFNIVVRQFETFFKRLPVGLNWIITFGFVNITWVIFRADSVGVALYILKSLVSLKFGQINAGIKECFIIPELQFIATKIVKIDSWTYYGSFCVLLFICFALFIVLFCKNVNEKAEEFSCLKIKSIFCAILLTMCIFSFSGVSTFLYFNF